MLLLKHVLTLWNLPLLMIELRLWYIWIQIYLGRHVFLESLRRLLWKACKFWNLYLTKHASFILAFCPIIYSLSLHVSVSFNGLSWFYFWCNICLYFSYIVSWLFSNCWCSSYCVNMFALVVTDCLATLMSTNLWCSKWVKVADLHRLIHWAHALNGAQLMFKLFMLALVVEILGLAFVLHVR